MLQSPALSAWPDWRAWLARALSRKGMEFHAGGHALRLEGNQHLKLHDAAGTLLQLTCGAAWITQEGDIKDTFVGRGECFRIERDGETLVAPLGSASLRLIPRCEAQAALALLPAGFGRSL